MIVVGRVPAPVMGICWHQKPVAFVDKSADCQSFAEKVGETRFLSLARRGILASTTVAEGASAPDLCWSLDEAGEFSAIAVLIAPRLLVAVARTQSRVAAPLYGESRKIMPKPSAAKRKSVLVFAKAAPRRWELLLGIAAENGGCSFPKTIVAIALPIPPSSVIPSGNVTSAADSPQSAKS
jgi:hypothetical protein